MGKLQQIGTAKRGRGLCGEEHAGERLHPLTKQPQRGQVTHTPHPVKEGDLKAGSQLNREGVGGIHSDSEGQESDLDPDLDWSQEISADSKNLPPPKKCALLAPHRRTSVVGNHGEEEYNKDLQAHPMYLGTKEETLNLSPPFQAHQA